MNWLFCVMYLTNYIRGNYMKSLITVSERRNHKSDCLCQSVSAERFPPLCPQVPTVVHGTDIHLSNIPILVQNNIFFSSHLVSPKCIMMQSSQAAPQVSSSSKDMALYQHLILKPGWWFILVGFSHRHTR